MKQLMVIHVWVIFLVGCSASPPELRIYPDTRMESVDEKSGLYHSPTGHWLVLPALDGGWQQFSVDFWSSSKRISNFESFDTSLVRATQQIYEISAVTAFSDVKLVGWHFKPEKAVGTGVVILHGSGNSDRSNSWYIYLAHQLASRGLDVILPDKRGSGRSHGDWRNIAFETLASDGNAWFQFLRLSLPDARLGYVGISQGGFISPVAALVSGADFAYVQSASATTLYEQLETEVTNDVANAGVPGWLNGMLTRYFVYRAKSRRPDFWKFNGNFRLTDAWLKWRGDMFIAYGELDEGDNVPVQLSVERLNQCCQTLPAIRWKIYTGVGHSLTAPENDKFPDVVIQDMMENVLGG